MICSHPQCNGKHASWLRMSDLCPAAADRKREWFRLRGQRRWLTKPEYRARRIAARCAQFKAMRQDPVGNKILKQRGQDMYYKHRDARLEERRRYMTTSAGILSMIKSNAAKRT